MWSPTVPSVFLFWWWPSITSNNSTPVVLGSEIGRWSANGHSSEVITSRLQPGRLPLGSRLRPQAWTYDRQVWGYGRRWRFTSERSKPIVGRSDLFQTAFNLLEIQAASRPAILILLRPRSSESRVTQNSEKLSVTTEKFQTKVLLLPKWGAKVSVRWGGSVVTG